MAQNMRDSTVYGCPAPALFVVEATGVADTSQYQPMSNFIEMALVACEPSDCAYRCWNE